MSVAFYRVMARACVGVRAEDNILPINRKNAGVNWESACYIIHSLFFSLVNG